MRMRMDGLASEDYHNFSQPSPSTHRLPTLSGAQDLLETIEKHKPISTHLRALDNTLGAFGHGFAEYGGIPKGTLTEVYGPPGSGKTQFALQLVANVLVKDGGVTWIDTAAKVPLSRLNHLLSCSDAGEDRAVLLNQVTAGEAASLQPKFEYACISSLSHLLGRVLHPSQDFPSVTTSLLVVDDFSSIVLTGLPQNDKLASSSAANGSTLSRDEIIAKSIAGRRAAMLNSISAGLARLAASRNIAVVVLNKASASRQNGTKDAILRSALSTQHWSENVSTRIAIYRDFWPTIDWSNLSHEEAKKQRKRRQWPLRVAEVERIAGKEVVTTGVRFVISKSRLQAVDEPPTTIQVKDVAPRSSSTSQQDQEEAVGNLELQDAGEPVDQGLRMPEDTADVSSSRENLALTNRPLKRTIDEVADSEDEDEVSMEDRSKSDRAQTSAPPANLGGFLPSSQLTQGEPVSSSPPVTRKLSGDLNSTVLDDNDEEEEMLLKD
ncbi:hypothetical protein LTR05_008487 [Lithohypha guttulata]|uniref:RecA family profile 1 domain-containing protein n=1 Tax=Lithohypha guttulata TaxID=1690604 RepID=A0AAN7SRX4_9EURO|nr:hypothetical protein LTR05_008487 [Lithohypha guttulata]